MPTFIHDADVRQEALNPTQSFIVQAPAGSGKTELLTQRYLILLSRAEKAPEEIIAITFTRKAASEMRARVLQALAFAEQPEPNKNDYRHHTWQLAKAVLKKNAALQWELQKNPNRLRILTIDALAALICQQTPLLTDFGGAPQISEDASVLYALAAERLLTTASEKLESLLLHLDNNVNKVSQLLVNLLNHRDQWLPHLIYSYRHGEGLRDLLENSLKRIVLEKMQMALNAIPPTIKQTLQLMMQHVGDYFLENNPASTLTHCAAWYLQNISLEDFPSWYAMASLLITQSGEWRKTVTIQQGFSPKTESKAVMLTLLAECEKHPNFKSALQDILLAPPTHYTETQWEAVTALATLLPLLAAQLHLVFQEKNKIDFIELNLRALKALGNAESPTDLALYLDYQIHHLLIDEFQDTSVVHLHLLEKLTHGWQHNDDRTLFVVGDPMQSIYRFRNAEVGLFLRAQQQGIGNITLKSLVLRMNFRSQPELVQWFNQTFQEVFPSQSDIATGCVPYTEAIAAKENALQPAVSFYPFILTDEKKDILEAATLSAKIKEIATQSPTDSIAILVRSRRQLIAIIPALQALELSFQAVDIEPLSDRTEIQDLLTLTRALLHRADRIAWLGLLRAPFCGCTLADLESIAIAAEKSTLWEIILSIETITTLSLDGLQRIQFLRHQLKKAFLSQYNAPLSRWIEKTWLSLNGPACLTHKESLNHARAYFNLVERMENDQNTVLIDQLIQQCQSLFAEDSTPLSSAIQIMTIHKSKGLEFDHVFIPGLHRQAAPDHEKLLRWYDRPNALGGDDLVLAPIKSNRHPKDTIYDYLKSIENNKQDHEITRLLYVAATRAKKSLHLFAQITWDEKKSELKSAKRGSFLEKLWPAYEETLATQKPTPHPTNDNVSEKNRALFSRLPSSFFTINDDVKTKAGQPVHIDIAPQETVSQSIGSVVHELFFEIATNNGTHNHSFTAYQKARCQSRLIALGVLPHELSKAMTIVEEAVTNAIHDTRGQWILSQHPNAEAEWALSSARTSEIKHVIVDRTFVENNTRWIIDYKISKPNTEESLNDFLENQKKQYQSQLENYAEIIAQTENRPTQLGLYFPLCHGWIAWPYKV